MVRMSPEQRRLLLKSMKRVGTLKAKSRPAIRITSLGSPRADTPPGSTRLRIRDRHPRLRLQACPIFRLSYLRLEASSVLRVLFVGLWRSSCVRSLVFFPLKQINCGSPEDCRSAAARRVHKVSNLGGCQVIAFWIPLGRCDNEARSTRTPLFRRWSQSTQDTQGAKGDARIICS
jgi:hypothetical protein